MTSISEDAARFVSAFDRLVKATGGDPSVVEERYHLDDELREIVDKASGAASRFEWDDRKNPSRIAVGVNPGFIDSWRKYERLYSPLISGSWIKYTNEIKPLIRRDRTAMEEWERADEIAGHFQNCAMRVIELAEEEFEMREGLQDNGQTEMDFDDGFEVFRHWLPGFGVNSRQSLRRHMLLRTVNLRSDIAFGGNLERSSMKDYLSEAHRAFVLGADFGAVILLRGVLEKTLQELYLSPKEVEEIRPTFRGGNKGDPGLSRLIDKASRGDDIKSGKWREIKRLGDSVAHKGYGADIQKLLSDKPRFEVKIADHFSELRKLIEQAPT